MNTRKRISVAVLALAGLATGAAVAKDVMDRGDRHGGGRGHHLLRALDADGDHVVTIEEARGLQLERLARFDADGDGSLSLDEFAPLFAEVARPRMVDAFQHLDADGDGDVTEAEMLTPIAKLTRMDRDGDGDVDRDDRPSRRGKGERP
ncbi:MAG: calcium-binding protein [Pseudomonadota bacterium]